MWECCNCIQINKDEEFFCEACGHNQCTKCNSIDTPKGLSNDEQIYYFYLLKFYQNDSILDPIEIAKLNSIAKDYSLNSKKIKKIFEKAELPIPKGINIDSSIDSKISLPSRTKSEKITLPSRVKEEKSFHHTDSKIKTKKKGKLKIFSIILLLLIIGLTGFYFFYKPSNLVRTFSGFSINVTDINFSPDGKTLVGCNGKELIVFDVEKGTTLSKNNINTKICDISNNGLYSITDDNKIYDIWRTQVIKTLPSEIPKKVKFSNDGKYLLIISEKEINGKNIIYTKFYNFTNGVLVFYRAFEGNFIANSSDGNLILIINENKLQIWNTYSRQIRKIITEYNFFNSLGEKIENKKQFIFGLKSISNDGNYLIHESGIIINLKAFEKKYLNRYIIKLFNRNYKAADFSSNDNFVATTDGKKINLWNLY